jgi:hypothetical protein
MSVLDVCKEQGGKNVIHHHKDYEENCAAGERAAACGTHAPPLSDLFSAPSASLRC